MGTASSRESRDETQIGTLLELTARTPFDTAYPCLCDHLLRRRGQLAVNCGGALKSWTTRVDCPVNFGAFVHFYGAKSASEIRINLNSHARLTLDAYSLGDALRDVEATLCWRGDSGGCVALGLPLPDEDERVRAGASPMAATTGGSAAARVIPCSGTYLEYDFNKHFPRLTAAMQEDDPTLPDELRVAFTIGTAFALIDAPAAALFAAGDRQPLAAFESSPPTVEAALAALELALPPAADEPASHRPQLEKLVAEARALCDGYEDEGGEAESFSDLFPDPSRVDSS